MKATAWVPSRNELVDVVFLVALLVLALLGFGSTYGGTAYLVVGGAGIGIGLLVAFLGERLNAPVLAVAAVTVVVFFLLGGAVALRTAVSGVVPSEASVRGLADGVVRGWHELLTVVPPVGTRGNAMAIPYLLGLVGTVMGYGFARRSRRVTLPVVSPVAVLALSILFGSSKPASLVLQGAVFATVALGWVAFRARSRTVHTGRMSYTRRATAAALLGLSAVCAALVGPVMPLAGAHERVVLRDHVDPPFDLANHPSPLSAFRKYVVPASKSSSRDGLGDKVLFTVQGLPKGALIRLATMDSYDGSVWNVAGGTAPSSGADVGASGFFQLVGERIPTSAVGQAATVEFTVGDLGSVWLPDVGSVVSARFHGDNATELAKTFRYNRATDSAVAATAPTDEPALLQPGDRYTLDVVVPATATSSPDVDKATLEAAAAAPFVLPEPLHVPDSVKARATDIVGDVNGTYARVRALAAEMDRGSFSDGTEGETPSLAGHYGARLDRMVSDPEGLVGDAEQYAALMALMTRQLGIPSRVVMGVKPANGATGSLTVKGTDVTAWVEVALQGIGWYPVFPTPTNTVKKPRTVPKPKPKTRVQEPPKTVVPPRVDVNATTSGAQESQKKDDARPPAKKLFLSRAHILLAAGVSFPVVVVCGVLGSIVGMKRRRSRRRRARGATSARISAGWTEIVDFVRDTGAPVPSKGTRRDIATLVGHSRTVALAHRADHAVFAPDEPSESDVADYWADVATARHEITSTMSRFDRLKAALNPTSLRG